VRTDWKKGGKSVVKRKGEMSFEEALAGLEQSAEALKADGATLEAAMESFEQGMKYYEHCSKILKDAKQKIEIFGKSGNAKEMEADAESGISEL
jgi:exodeoxyribonuclease VII small subunit